MRMNIAYACNDAYIEQTSVSLISLFENNLDIDEIYIFFIDMGLSRSNLIKLKKLVGKYNRIISIIPFDNIAYDLKIEETGRHIASVYAKIFFGRIPQIDRIIYLDSDVIVCSSLAEFWNTAMDGKSIAGVETIHTVEQNQMEGLEAEEIAINDGVVLMDLAMWRNERMMEKCLDYISACGGNPPVLSEGTINYVCRGRIKVLDPRYNFLSGFVAAKSDRVKKITGRHFYDQCILDDAKANPCIIHYLSGSYNRPWCVKCSHPMKSYYLYYRQLSEWKDDPLSDKRLPISYVIKAKLYGCLPPSFVRLMRTVKLGLKTSE